MVLAPIQANAMRSSKYCGAIRDNVSVAHGTPSAASSMSNFLVSCVPACILFVPSRSGSCKYPDHPFLVLGFSK